MLHSAQDLLRLLTSRFVEHRCIQVAGDLTFTTLLALVPFFTIALTLFAAFPMFADWSNAFKVFLLTTLVPEVSGKVITVYMQQFADNAAQLTALGLVFLAVTALMLMVSIERVFNVIWRAHRQRSVVRRLAIYWATITVGPLLIGASLSLTSWLVTKSLSSVEGIEGVEGAQDLLLRVVPVVLNGVAFALLYLMIPNRKVMIKDALVGGIAAALAFELLKWGFGLYVRLFPTYSLIYGTFATIPIFLLWIYLSWLVILLAAVLVAVLPYWRAGARQIQAGVGSDLFRALRLLETLQAARMRSETPTVAQLAVLSGVAEEHAEHLLEGMQGVGWVRRVDPAGWVLVCDVATLRAVDVYRLFAVDASRDVDLDGALAPAVARRLLCVEKGLDVSLQVLLNEAKPPCATGDAEPPPAVTGVTQPLTP